ncbi:MAG: hypothetical protein HY824_12965 [Acidobacteria bacterium]|nr:hypothetical protein [Acidobacteriota bacterium]
MRTRCRLAAPLLVLVIAVCVGGAVSAHHSRAGYDTAKEHLTTQQVVVTEVIWRNPHVYLIWDSKDGGAQKWTGEFSSPATMLSEGLSRATFKAGDPITVTFMPAKSGNPQGLVIKIVRPDGKVIIDLSERRGLLEQ